ncbi:MAG TPA: deoxyribodipyrimidine photolyase, partial [Planctomycetaceae bacterium]|nr:deoxyribodipyrimidine photolyase [Planctomycetaceae bacterium]
MSNINKPEENDLLGRLPPHLRERTRRLPKASHAVEEAGATGEFVVYWMVSAVRLDENPALDVAQLLAAELDLPLVIYHGLSDRYAYASDRHHTFILQAAAEIQKECAERGWNYLFYLERPSDLGDGPRPAPLRELAKRAQVVVTEDMPTQPQRGFARSLARTFRDKIYLVNTSCVVAPQLVGKAHDRAFAYRDATRELYQERIGRAWPTLESLESRGDGSPLTRAFNIQQFSDHLTDLSERPIHEWVAQCEIDHTVGPVLDTPGGSQAGYERWRRFVKTGLARYARRRNDPLADGVSRMSAYLHYGMVSPMRIAREAQELAANPKYRSGAEKYLDELLIWRELAYCFCSYRTDHGNWSALPNWARETIRRHSSDSRSYEYTWEQLARAETHDSLWNSAQRSLLIHGELHNNVRMTWGKAFLEWCCDPEDAFRWVIDLNHRYALDGRDPASYGGILWCFGQFDRPFKPERPVIGTIRSRPTTEHARRLDLDAYAVHTSTPRLAMVPSIAVIGAGIAGCIAARTLADHGLPVQIFEKSRGAGGRMATRRTPTGEFDHGAQYFTARDPRFRRLVDDWARQGVAGRWKGRIVAYEAPGSMRDCPDQHRFVGVPAMNRVAKHIAGDLNIATETQVASVEPCKVGSGGDASGERLRLIDAQGNSLGEFDRVIVTAPAPQATEILSKFPSLVQVLAGCQLNPCWAAMLGWPEELDLPFDGAFINTGWLSWVARSGRKPGRGHDGEHLVVHASADWSRTHLEETKEDVAARMLQELEQVIGRALPVPETSIGHRWRYAIPASPLRDRCVSNAE